MRMALMAIGTAALVSGTVAVAQSDNWRNTATARDEQRIGSLSRSWDVGLREAARSNMRALDSLGVVVRPTAALARPQPTPGNYRCRTIKLGSKDGNSGFIMYGWFRCRVELSPGGDLSLRKVNGSQRPSGQLYPLGRRQLAFLGTLALSSSERTWPRYGSLPDRDVAGVFERIGPNHYRLLMPQPEYESELDILELRRS